MKNHRLLVLPLLATSLILASCGTTVASSVLSSSIASSATVSSSASSAASSSAGTSSEGASSAGTSSSAASSAASSSASSGSESSTSSQGSSSPEGSSSSEVSSSSEESSSSAQASSSESPQEEYGAFSVTPADGFDAPVFDADADAYTFTILSAYAAKPTYTLSGYFDGSIVIVSEVSKNSIGMTFLLDQAYLTNTAEGGIPISYQAKKKTVTLNSVAGTVNTIAGTGDALYSANNAELCGDGTLNLASLTANAVEAVDIKIYGAVTLDMAAALDALKGSGMLYSDNEDTPFVADTGSTAIHDLGGIAFDFGGSASKVDIGAGDLITVETAANLVKAGSALTVEGSLIGTDISGAPIVPAAAGGLTVTVAALATFTSNGTAITSQTL